MKFAISVLIASASLVALAALQKSASGADESIDDEARAILQELARKSPMLTLGRDSVADRFQFDFMVSAGDEDQRFNVLFRIQRVKSRAAILCIAADRRVEALIQDRRFVFASPVGGHQLDWADGNGFIFRFPEHDDSKGSEQNGPQQHKWRLQLPLKRGDIIVEPEVTFDLGRIWNRISEHSRELSLSTGPPRIVAVSRKGSRAELDLAPRGAVYPISRFRLELSDGRIIELRNLVFGDDVNSRLITTSTDDLRNAGFEFSDRPLDQNGVLVALDRIFDGSDDPKSTRGQDLFRLLAKPRDADKPKPRSP